MYGRTRARRTLLIALLLGLVAVGWGLWGLRKTRVFRYIPLVGWMAQEAPPTPAPSPTPPPTAGPPSPGEAIALIQGYNQADVTANRSNDVRHLLPYLHPNGPHYERLAVEYRRRIAQGEVHHVQLTRFWAADPQVTEGEVVVETREIWDETALDAESGAVLWLETGIETHQRYTIRPDAGGLWRIWEIEMVEGGVYTP